MRANVKGASSTGEQLRTRQARAAVISAARRLFLNGGYATTTLAEIARESGIPSATLYRLFETKIGVLRAVLDVAAGGDDEPVAFGDRPDVLARLQLQDPRQQLTAFAQLAGAVMQRLAPVHRLLESAAASDPQAAGLLADFTEQRRTGQARIAAALAAKGALRRGLTERSAADTVFALMSPQVFLLLTETCGWKPTQYEVWLAETLQRQLLDNALTRP